MLDYTIVRDIRQKATNEAARKGLIPCLVDTALINIFRRGQTSGKLIPFLGDYHPVNWHPVENAEYFVDTTGLGASNEPAYTWDGFANILEQYNDGRHGVGITEVGQFQAYVQIYERTV